VDRADRHTLATVMAQSRNYHWSMFEIVPALTHSTLGSWRLLNKPARHSIPP
jgi:hypothetical protein